MKKKTIEEIHAQLEEDLLTNMTWECLKQGAMPHWADDELKQKLQPILDEMKKHGLVTPYVRPKNM